MKKNETKKMFDADDRKGIIEISSTCVKALVGSVNQRKHEKKTWKYATSLGEDASEAEIESFMLELNYLMKKALFWSRSQSAVVGYCYLSGECATDRKYPRIREHLAENFKNLKVMKMAPVDEIVYSYYSHLMLQEEGAVCRGLTAVAEISHSALGVGVFENGRLLRFESFPELGMRRLEEYFDGVGKPDATGCYNRCLDKYYSECVNCLKGRFNGDGHIPSLIICGGAPKALIVGEKPFHSAEGLIRTPEAIKGRAAQYLAVYDGMLSSGMDMENLRCNLHHSKMTSGLLSSILILAMMEFWHLNETLFFGQRSIESFFQSLYNDRFWITMANRISE